MGVNSRQAQFLVQQLAVLVVDDNAFMRKLVRSMLASIGVKTVFEAGDGIDALEMIRTAAPDVVILDWEMPLLNGPELVRIVRSPAVFPMPDIPIIMLTGHGDRCSRRSSASTRCCASRCRPRRCSTGWSPSCSSRAPA
jgi:two-component system chemotaxis response regulator CheY